MNIAEWANSNNPNSVKFMFMVVSLSLSLFRLQFFDIFLNDVKIKIQSFIKILRVYVDFS